jgi:hypothetical protein
MSEQGKNNEWDSLWGEYTKSLENWKSLFEQIQTASNDMQSKFNGVWDKATVESSTETMKLFGENWQKALNEAGMNSFKGFGENWQKALNDTNASVFKQFAGNWQKTLSSSGLEQMNAYGEMMKKFAETWTSMWPQSK